MVQLNTGAGSVGPGAARDTAGPDLVARIVADPEFQTLVRQRNRLGLFVVGTIIVVYFGYILLLAFAPGLMRSKVSSAITTGFPLGLGVLVVTFLLVAFYVGRSASKLDPDVARIVERATS
jgi:uncharacterized membrane protein (DUF485 family)